MSFSSWLRSWKCSVSASRRSTQASPRQRASFRPRLEALEARTLLSISGVPVFTPQGPGPVLNSDGTTEGAGAIEAIATQPGNPNNVYVGAVNGGIWQTSHALSANPDWTVQTDSLPSPSIGALAFAPWDSSGATLFAGFADTSSLVGFGGVLPGLLKTTNGGENWAIVPVSGIVGHDVHAIATTTDSAADVVLVASSSGLLRSNDGGSSFQQVLAGACSDVVVDPANPVVVYAAQPGSGIFRSIDAGSTWTAVNSGIGGFIGTEGIKLADHFDSASGIDAIYAVDANKDKLAAVVRSIDQGDSWQFLDTPDVAADLSQGHLSIAADSSSPYIVYVGGYGGHDVYRINALVSSGSQITALGDGHADSRGMAVDASGNLLEADDGGIWRLSDPRSSTGPWVPMDGNLQITESVSAAHDYVNNIYLTATQDNGTSQQVVEYSPVWEHAVGGDGTEVAVDDSNSSAVVRYFEGNTFADFSRYVYDNTNHLVSSTQIQLASGPGQGFLSGLEEIDRKGALAQGDEQGSYVLNAANPRGTSKSMLLGNQGVYESTDQGDTITDITPAGESGMRGLAYGGEDLYSDNGGNTTNPYLALVGFKDQTLWVRTGDPGSGSTLQQDTAWSATNGVPLKIALDPEDWHVVFIVTDKNSVFMGTHVCETGETWQNITNDLNSVSQGSLSSSTTFPSDQRLRSLAVVPTGGGYGNDAVLVGDLNGVYKLNIEHGYYDPGVDHWSRFGANLPNVLVKDINYDPFANTLTVATLGRGVWSLAKAFDYVGAQQILTITPSSLYDSVRLVLDPFNPNLLDVYQNNTSSTPNAVVSIASLAYVSVEGLIPLDTEFLTIDNSNGTVNVPIHYDGSIGTPYSTNPKAILFVTGTNYQYVTEDGSEITWGSGPGSVTGSADLVNVGNVEFDSSSSGASFSVLATDAGVFTNLNCNGPDTILIGDPSTGVQEINGNISIVGHTDNTALVVDDSANNFASCAATISSQNEGGYYQEMLSGLSPADILLPNSLGRLTIRGGSVRYFWDIENTPAPTTIDASNAAINTFHITALAQDLANLNDLLVLYGTGNDKLAFYDQNDPNKDTDTIDLQPSSLTLTPPGAQVDFYGMASLSFETVDAAQAENLINAVNALTAPSTPETITLDLANGVNLTDVTASPPKGVTLIINGAAGSTTIVGNSPALTVLSGDVIVENGVTLSTSTAAPTILVKGGSLTLRNDTIEQTSASGQAAVSILGGQVDLGTAGDPGGNTFLVAVPGVFVSNSTARQVFALGDAFETQQGKLLTDPYAIESQMVDGVSAEGIGLVTFVANNVYVPRSLSTLQYALDAAPAGYTINVQAGGSYSDYTITQPLTVSFQNGPTLQLAADAALAAGTTTLRVWGGPQDNTDIAFTPGSLAGSVNVSVNGYPTASFAPAGATPPLGGIVAHTGKGKDDEIQVDHHITLLDMLFADGLDAQLFGGGGPTVEVGGGGTQTQLHGGTGRSLLIAGVGGAHLHGGDNGDILIGGTTIYDNDTLVNETALAMILKDWTSTASFDTRVNEVTQYLNSSTVSDNGVADHLEGGAGQNLFFAGKLDKLSGKHKGWIVDLS